MAQLHAAPRRGGKTEYLLKQMRLYPRSVMVCANRQMADMVADANPDIPRVRFLSIHTAQEALKGMDHNMDVYVDNAEMVLSFYLGREVRILTMTPEEC